MFTTEEKVRITNQVCELWVRDMAPEGCVLLAIRFDNSVDPRKEDENGYYENSVCFIFKDGSAYESYVYTWAELDVSEDGTLNFTEDSWESWGESGVEPYRCSRGGYDIDMEEAKTEHPEWDIIHIKTEYTMSIM